MSYVSPYERFSELERAVAQRDALADKLAEYIRVHELTVAAKETWREEAHRIAGDLSAANAKLAEAGRDCAVARQSLYEVAAQRNEAVQRCEITTAAHMDAVIQRDAANVEITRLHQALSDRGLEWLVKPSTTEFLKSPPPQETTK